MTDRHTVNTITSDALDALYEQLEAAEDTESQRQLATAREALASATTRAARADAALARLQALADEHPAGIDPALVHAALTDRPAATQAPVVDRQTAVVLAALHRSAEADVSRVIALYERWRKSNRRADGRVQSRWWDKRLVELGAALRSEQPGVHRYLSTGCYHGDHAYCQSMTGLNGAKRPASCKFCQAACQCECHTTTKET
jgi:hypothetical protein